MRRVYARSTEGGQTWTTPTDLPGQSTISGLMSIFGYLVVSRSGRIYCVYQQALGITDLCSSASANSAPA